MNNPQSTSSTPKRPVRRLNPEAAAALLARSREQRLEELYLKPVDKLEPEEIAQMKAAFFRA